MKEKVQAKSDELNEKLQVLDESVLDQIVGGQSLDDPYFCTRCQIQFETARDYLKHWVESPNHR